MSEQQRQDVYTIVTNRIIELLEAGCVPWQQPWLNGQAPMNLLSKNPYRGINLLLLNALGYEQPYYLTWKQVNELGATVKKGERSRFVVFWQRKEKQEGESELSENTSRKTVLRYYSVFNIEQCVDIPEHLIPETPPPSEIQPIDRCVEVVSRMQQPPKIIFKGHEAYYAPKEDTITIPKQKSFATAEGFYNILFHELVHSTGHPSRLDRKEIATPDSFASESYSLEELTAEIGASFLSAYTGITQATIHNSAAYIASWLKVLRGDKRFVVFASSRAQKAVDLILNIRDTTMV